MLKRSLLLVSIGLLVAQCGDGKRAHERDNSNPAQVVSGSTAMQLCDKELAGFYRTLAPSDWILQDCDNDSAQFRVPLGVISSTAHDGHVTVSIFRDNRKDYLVDRYLLNPNAMQEAERRDRDEISAYPKVPGFRAYFDGASVGYYPDKKIYAREIRYWNEAAGVFCWGLFPEQMQCQWGPRGARRFVGFDSKHMAEIMIYASKVAVEF